MNIPSIHANVLTCIFNTQLILSQLVCEYTVPPVPTPHPHMQQPSVPHTLSHYLLPALQPELLRCDGRHAPPVIPAVNVKSAAATLHHQQVVTVQRARGCVPSRRVVQPRLADMMPCNTHTAV